MASRQPSPPRGAAAPRGAGEGNRVPATAAAANGFASNTSIATFGNNSSTASSSAAASSWARHLDRDAVASVTQQVMALLNIWREFVASGFRSPELCREIIAMMRPEAGQLLSRFNDDLLECLDQCTVEDSAAVVAAGGGRAAQGVPSGAGASPSYEDCRYRFRTAVVGRFHRAAPPGDLESLPGVVGAVGGPRGSDHDSPCFGLVHGVSAPLTRMFSDYPRLLGFFAAAFGIVGSRVAGGSAAAGSASNWMEEAPSVRPAAVTASRIPTTSEALRVDGASPSPERRAEDIVGKSSSPRQQRESMSQPRDVFPSYPRRSLAAGHAVAASSSRATQPSLLMNGSVALSPSGPVPSLSEALTEAHMMWVQRHPLDYAAAMKARGTKAAPTGGGGKPAAAAAPFGASSGKTTAALRRLLLLNMELRFGAHPERWCPLIQARDTAIAGLSVLLTSAPAAAIDAIRGAAEASSSSATPVHSRADGSLTPLPDGSNLEALDIDPSDGEERDPSNPPSPRSRGGANTTTTSQVAATCASSDTSSMSLQLVALQTCVSCVQRLSSLPITASPKELAKALLEHLTAALARITASLHDSGSTLVGGSGSQLTPAKSGGFGGLLDRIRGNSVVSGSGKPSPDSPAAALSPDERVAKEAISVLKAATSLVVQCQAANAWNS